jgi:hypothetical protein
MDPTFLKLNRPVRRKTQLGLNLEENEIIYSPDYMGVYLAPISLKVESTNTRKIELPEIKVAKEYTAVIVPNPELYKFGEINGPIMLTHTGSEIKPKFTFRPFKKGQIDLPWTFEVRLMG